MAKIMASGLGSGVWLLLGRLDPDLLTFLRRSGEAENLKAEAPTASGMKFGHSDAVRSSRLESVGFPVRSAESLHSKRWCTVGTAHHDMRVQPRIPQTAGFD